MRRIAILTAGGDTPALNATMFGAVERANQLKIEVVGVIRGFAGILDERLPHVRLNPLFSTIPELDLLAITAFRTVNHLVTYRQFGGTFGTG